MELDRRTFVRGTAAISAAGALTFATTGHSASAADLARTHTLSAVAKPTLRVGSRGAAVVALQSRLSSLGYWLGSVDGIFGNLTFQAVIAIQKVSGISRDGICGPVTWSKVDAGVRPSVRSTIGHVCEVNKVTQVLIVADSGRATRIFSTSTGKASTPTPAGTFRVFRSVDGWDPGPNGSLYRPRYFNGGIAVHGYPSVPVYPASHGCCRVSLPAMDLLWATGALPIGALVRVY